MKYLLAFIILANIGCTKIYTEPYYAFLKAQQNPGEEVCFVDYGFDDEKHIYCIEEVKREK